MDRSSPERGDSPAHVAFGGWNAGPVLGLDPRGSIGGLETFTCQFAAALADTGRYRVSVSVRVARRPRDVRWRSIRIDPFVERLRDTRLAVSRSIERVPHFPWLRMRVWRTPLIWQVPTLAFAQLLGYRPHQRLARHCVDRRPDVWVALGCSSESAVVVRSAVESGVPCALWLQSNADLDPRFFRDPSFVNAYGVRASDARDAVQCATWVVCQTDWQRERIEGLRTERNLVIRNPVEIAKWRAGTIDDAARRHVLWVGRYDRFHKRPLLGIELARRTPGIPFVFVCGGGDPDVEAEVRRAIPPNGTIVERVAHERMPEQFAKARLLLFTGSREHEGFPNVLLESAAAGVPIASFDDFDRFLERSGAGIVLDGEADQAARQVESLWSDSTARALMARRAARHLQREHDMRTAVAEFSLLLDAMIADRARATVSR